MTQDYRKYLQQQGLSANTIQTYVWTADFFCEHYGEPTENSLLLYKSDLLDNFAPKTVNLRIQAMNKYLDFFGTPELKIKPIRLQGKSYCENVITNADYQFLANSLKEDKNFKWYFVVRFLAATGARISELLQFKVEHIKMGYVDLYCKGGKIRRIYIPCSLKDETEEWLANIHKHSGYLFCNRSGQQLTARGVAQQLKHYAEKYGIDRKVVYPHSFRHRFAKNFLDKYNDIALLADLMGHESIETTRIYLRRTASEQRKIVDEVVTW